MKNSKWNFEKVTSVALILLIEFIFCFIQISDLAAAGALTNTNVEPVNLTAGATGNVDIYFTTATALPDNGRVLVIFPAGFAVAGANTPTSPDNSIDGTFTITIIGQRVTIKRAADGNLRGAGVLHLSIQGVTNPTNTGATGTYTIKTRTQALIELDADEAVGSDTIIADTAIDFSVDPASFTQTAGAGFNVGITAIDQYGNTNQSYDPTGKNYSFSGPSNSPDNTSPACPNSTTVRGAFSNGVATITFTLFKMESVSLFISDGNINGTSNAISVDHGTRDNMSIDSGNNQVYLVNMAVPGPLKVKVVDGYGNPVDGETVTCAVRSGGGSLEGATPQTDANGLAQPTSWTLGSTPGNNTMNASISGGNGLTAVIFTAIGIRGMFRVGSGQNFSTIQDAIDTIGAGNTVFVHNGTYYENVFVNKNITLVGESNTTTIIDGNGTGHSVWVNISGVKVSGFKITNGTGSSNSGVQLFNVSGCEISNCNITGNKDGIYLDSSVSNRIVNNTICMNSDDGLYLSSSRSNSIINNTVFSNADTGIWLSSSAFSSLCNNRLWNNTYNFGVVGEYAQNTDRSNTVNGKPIYYLMYENDRIIPVDAGFVGLIYCDNITVKDLTLSNNCYGVVMLYSTNSSIINNTMHMNYNGMYLSFSNSNMIINNTIYANEFDGMEMYKSNSTIIKNNTINSNKDDGMTLTYSNSSSISNNSIYSNDDDGIYVSNSISNIISDNTINSNKDDGIDMSDSRSSIISKNTIYSNNDDGICIPGSSLITIKNNSIFSNKESGIKLYESISNNIHNNGIFSNEGYGHYMEKSNSNRIMNNSVYSNNEVGILLYDSSRTNTVINNSIYSNNKSGLYIWKSSDSNTILNNNLHSNKWDGFTLLEVDSNIIENNSVYSNKDNGIFLRSSSSNFMENNSISNNGDGIDVDETSNSNTITHNTIYSNTYDGISLKDTSDSNSIAKNYIYSNTLAGIRLKDSCESNTIDNNSIYSNQEEGVHLSESDSNRVVNNTIYLNDDEGIMVHKSILNKIMNNSIYSNNKAGIWIKGSDDSNTITCNSIANNDHGIHISSAHFNMIDNNSLTNDGVFIEANTRNDYYQNIGANNLVNGRTLHYHQDQSGLNITGDNAGQVILINCSDSIVNNVVGSNTSVGVELAYSSNITIDNSTFSNNTYGIYLASSSILNSIINNSISNNTQGIFIGATRNTFNGNNISIYSDQVAFYFHMNFNYNNTISTTNTVNGTPMRWYTNLHGTINSHVVIQNAYAEMPGVTNVAQIMFYNCKYVDLECSSAKNGTGYGIFLHSTSSNITLENCSAGHNDNYGIYMYSSSTNTITNNSIYSNNKHGIFLYPGSYSNTLENNSIYSNHNAGITLWGDSTSNIIRDNAILNNSDGIQLLEGGSNKIINNSIHSNNNNGIMCRSSALNTIINNSIYSNNDKGIFILSTEEQITSNVITYNSISDNGYGIYISKSCSNEIENNSINSNEGDGIGFIYSSSNKITNNSMSNNNHGIYCFESNVNTVKNNTFEDDGIFIYSNNLEDCYHNISSDNQVNGKPLYYFRDQNGLNFNGNAIGQIILINCTNSTVKNVNISNTSAGMHLAYSSNATITNSTFSNNTYGIYLTGTSYLNNMTNNNLSNNKIGFMIKSEHNIFKSNDISISSGQKAFYFGSDCYNNTVPTTNTVNSTPMRWYTNLKGTPESHISINNISGEIDGMTNIAQIMFYNCQYIDLKDSVARNGTGNGIYLHSTSSNITIDNCTVGLNDKVGVYLDSSDSNTVTNNSLFSNGELGICLSESISNKIINNSIYSNNNNGIELSSSESNKINNNYIYSNNKDGIDFSSSDSNMIENNSIYSNTMNGIDMASSDSNTIKNNSINSNNEKGIYLTSSNSNTIAMNHISNNSEGVRIIQSYLNTITYNYISGNGDGIRMRGLSPNNSVHNNNIYQNKDHGIIIEDSEAEVNATRNWWGATSGPYHASINPSGTGDNITDYVLFDPWLTVPLDEVSPTITDNSPDTGTTGDRFIFNVTASDNFEVDTVHVNWTHDALFGNISLAKKNGCWIANITLGHSVHDLIYTIYAKDISNNFNTSIIQRAVIGDNDLPTYTDNCPEMGTTGDNYTFNITASDNIDVDSIYVNWSHAGSFGNNSLQETNDNWRGTITLNHSLYDLTYVIYINDNSNNYNISDRMMVEIVDNDLPTFSDNSLGRGTTGDDFIFNVSAVDNVNVPAVHVNWSHGVLTGNVSLSRIDDHWIGVITLDNSLSDLTYIIYINDTSNNYNISDPRTVSVTDNDLPNIVDNSPITGTTGDRFRFNITASDNMDVMGVRVNWSHGAQFGNISLQKIDVYWTNMITLDHDIQDLIYIIHIIDSSINYNRTFPRRIPVTDNDLSIFMDNSPNKSTTGDTFSFNITAFDNIEIGTVYINWSHGALYGNISLFEENEFWYANITLDNDLGNLTYTIYVNDTSNNFNMSGLMTAMVTDNDIPNFIDNNPDNGTTGDRFTFNISTSDNVGVDSVHMNWSHGALSGNISLTGITDYWRGDIVLDAAITDFTYRIFVFDTSDNLIISPLQTRIVRDNDDPVAVIHLKQKIDQYVPFHLDGSASNDNIEVTNWTWSFFDRIDVVLYGMNRKYSIDAAGSYEITLTVTDATGNSHSRIILVNVSDSDKPVADAGEDRILDLDSMLILEGFRSKDNIGIVNYTWDFTYDEKAILLSGKVSTFKVSIPGEYVIKLTVEDAMGNTDTDTVNVIVLPEEGTFIGKYRIKNGIVVDIVETDLDSGIVVSIRVSGNGTLVGKRFRNAPVEVGALPTQYIRLGFFLDLELDGDLQWLNITFDYTSISTKDSIDFSSAKLYYFKNGKWIVCERTGVDTEAKLIWANITHLTVLTPIVESIDKGASEPAKGKTTMLIIATIAVVAILVLALFFLLIRRRRKRERSDLDKEVVMKSIKAKKEEKKEEGKEAEKEEDDEKDLFTNWVNLEEGNFKFDAPGVDASEEELPMEEEGKEKVELEKTDIDCKFASLEDIEGVGQKGEKEKGSLTNEADVENEGDRLEETGSDEVLEEMEREVKAEDEGDVDVEKGKEDVQEEDVPEEKEIVAKGAEEEKEGADDTEKIVEVNTIIDGPTEPGEIDEVEIGEGDGQFEEMRDSETADVIEENEEETGKST